MSAPSRAAAERLPATPAGPVGGSSAWRGDDLARSSEVWAHRLTVHVRRDIESARRFSDVPSLTAEEVEAFASLRARHCVPLQPC